MRKSISIIVPVYYGEKYIAGIIKQVEACQRYLELQNNLELLFINDAPDAPLSQKWQSEQIHVIIINTNKNIGIHGARIKGLKRCNGEYVLFLDQDDRIVPEYLNSQLRVIGENDVAVCRAIHGNKLYYSEYPIFENILSKKLMLTEWNPIISPGQALLKKQSIPSVWSENILKSNGADDWFLWLSMLAAKCSFVLNQEVLYEHILSEKNASKDIVGMLKSEQEVLTIVQEKRMFSDSDFELLLGGFFKKNIERIKNLTFFRDKLKLLDKWMLLNENNIMYSQYLKQLGIRSIAIYGCGTLGEYLFAELKNEIEVKYFIDRNAKEIHKKIPVYLLQDNLPQVDGVVVTLIKDSKKVADEIKETLCDKVLILKEWLMETELLSRNNFK